MPEPTSQSAGADRNLLFGILALQMGFISRGALVAAMNAWALDKTRSLGEILRVQGQLTPERLELLEGLVREHLKAHGDDADQSLAALDAPTAVPQEVRAVAGKDPQPNQEGSASSAGTDPDSTGPYFPSASEDVALRYRILRPHAQGGLGEVFVAEDRELGREVALKQIRPEHADDQHSRGRFVLEAEVNGRLEHPGIVPVYGLGRYADGRPFYAMRLVQGDTFKEAVQRFHEADQQGRDPGERSLGLRQLLSRFVTVCNTVAYAHSRGVLHRDIKPSNILLGLFGETLLVDWGLAKRIADCSLQLAESQAQTEGLGSTQPPPYPGNLQSEIGNLQSILTQPGSALGTPAFMSPEAAGGRTDQIGPASDIYSLGATLYALLTGQAPIQGTDKGEMLRRASRGDWRPCSHVKKDVPAALDAVCRKAMSLKPDDRYPTALALAEDVEHWLADEPLAVYHEPLPARLGRWARRHKPLVSGTAALLVTAVAGLVVGLVFVQREQARTETARKDTVQALVAEGQARRRAREALDEVSSGVIRDLQTRQISPTPEQRKFLERMLASYEEFARETGNDPEHRAGLARAHFQVGGIEMQLGQLAAAEAAFRRSLELWKQLAVDLPGEVHYREERNRAHERLAFLLAFIIQDQEAGETAWREVQAGWQELAAAVPAEPRYQGNAATALASLGQIQQASGRSTKAEAAYQAAIGMHQKVAALAPEESEYRWRLAMDFNYLGSLLLNWPGRRGEAEAHYRKAITILEKLCADFTGDYGHRWQLAYSLTNLGTFLDAEERNTEAEKAYREALAIREKLAGEYPGVPEYRRIVAQSCHRLGVFLTNLNRPKEAEIFLREALVIREKLAAEFPETAAYHNQLADTLGYLSYVVGNRKDLAAKRQLLEQALPHHRAALKADPNSSAYRLCFTNNTDALAQTLLALGDHAAAAEFAGEMCRRFDPARDAYNGACVLSRCVPLAVKDAKLTPARRAELTRSYADRALNLLQQAIANGFKDAAHMKIDPDLEPLRSRADFKTLLAGLEKSKPME